MNLNLSSIKIRTAAALAAWGCFSATAQPTNRVDPKSFEAFKLVNERNIFDVNRRPPRGIKPPSTPVDSFTLTGTMSFENSLLAVFDGSSLEYHKAIGPGGRISQYTVKEITHEFVKLVSGTNEVELKVGMQCHRSEDGKWSVGAGGDASSFAYNSNSRMRSFGRNDRFDRNDRNDRGSRNNFRTGFRPSGGSESGMGGPASGGSGDATPSSGAGNPDDIIARMMANRAAQVGGNTGQNDNGSGGQPQDQNSTGGFQGDNSTGNPNGGNTPPENQTPIPNVPNQDDNPPNGNPGANQDNPPNQ